MWNAIAGLGLLMMAKGLGPVRSLDGLGMPPRKKRESLEEEFARRIWDDHGWELEVEPAEYARHIVSESVKSVQWDHPWSPSRFKDVDEETVWKLIKKKLGS